MMDNRIKAIPTNIEGVFAIEPAIFLNLQTDTVLLYNKKMFREIGIDVDFVQENQSRSRKNVIRGVDIQLEHPQGKLVRCLFGAIFDVAVDLRKNSPTYGGWTGIKLTDENKKQLYLPAGVAHGFLTLTNYADICFMATDFYHPEDHVTGVMWNDPTIGIQWPEMEGAPILAEKDSRYPPFL